MEKLNAATLKRALWETLHKVKDGSMEASQGDAVAAQAREILRTAKVQLSIMDKARLEISTELTNFAMNTEI